MEAGDHRASVSCAGGGPDKTIINRIMLGFRPIAPKPADGAQVPGVSPLNGKNLLDSKRRTKRKYVRVCKSKRFRREKKKVTACGCDQLQRERDSETIENALNGVVTLQLLPERSDLRDSPGKEGPWCNLDLNLKQPVIDPTLGMIPQRLVVVDTWVTVECVTDTYSCMDGKKDQLGLGEAERVKIELEGDTCPGFVSDGWNNVEWVNGAFKRMVTATGNGEGCSPEIRVQLGYKETLLPYVQQSGLMTCWVKLRYTLQKEKCCMMVPCDAWRLDSGGFAWKLDVGAALRLGR